VAVGLESLVCAAGVALDVLERDGLVVGQRIQIEDGLLATERGSPCLDSCSRKINATNHSNLQLKDSVKLNSHENK